MTAEANIMQFPEKSLYSPETADEFLVHHEEFVRDNPAPGWLQDLRRMSAQKLADQGLPTPKLERWKYTNLAAAVKGLGGDMAATDVKFEDPEGLVSWLSDVYQDTPDWLIELQSAVPPQEDTYQDWALWHMTNAFLRDGLLIDVPADKIVERPVEIMITGHADGFFVPRTAFRLGQGAELIIIENHSGSGRFWNNRLTQIIVGPNARLRHYRVQDYSHDAVYTQNTHVQVERDGVYEAFTLTKGAQLSRNQIHADLLGNNAAANIYGINLLEDRQHGDTTILAEHHQSHGCSRQFIRSILDDQARGVFQGKVYVHREAQKTDGYQLSNTILLSETAEMDTKPELEIYADDVKCSHGATTGQLEEEALFYLRSRGMTEAQARRLLIEAFVDEVVDNLDNESFQREVREECRQWLQKAL